MSRGPGSLMMTPPDRRRAWTSRKPPTATMTITTTMINHTHHGMTHPFHDGHGRAKT